MPAPAPIRVLLVEDDEEDYLLTRDLFNEVEGVVYALDWARTFEQGRDYFAQRAHDVYLIDYRLGANTGMELLASAEALGLRAPIILLTGQGATDLDIAAMRAGAADFLIKGEITARSLERSVRYAIERKRSEQQIEKLAAFPRRNPNPVLEFNADGTLSYSNDAANALAQSLGEPSLRGILPADVMKIVTESLRTGTTPQTQTNHGTRSFTWSFVPVPESNVVHGYAKEITERLNLEAQLRHSVKMEAVGQLAAGVAHDFNNMLTVIQGHANLILGAHLHDDALARPLKQICSVAERAGNLIRQLLMFSRKQVMQPRQLDVSAVLTGMSGMLQRVMGEDIALEVVSTQNLPTVYGDAGMLEQVIVNLAVNARDAMPNGGRFRLETSLQQFDASAPLLNPEAREGEFLCVAVADTGCGMDVVTLNRIFEPFFTTKEVGKGTGLGLATVYGIIKQHNGWIEVESQIGQGTTFRIYLPATPRQPAPAPEPPIERERERRANGGKETVLVVEDEDPLRELVTEILTIFGYQVISADSGFAALKLWPKHREEVDLLLTDMVMPLGVSGRDLAERLLRDRPDLKVIYTSGYSPGMAGKDLALLEGFNFLAKPYSPNRLAEMVRECLDGRLETAARGTVAAR